MKIVKVQEPVVQWKVEANIGMECPADDIWYKFEYLHEDGDVELVQDGSLSYCIIPESDTVVKMRISASSAQANFSVSEDVLIRPR